MLGSGYTWNSTSPFGMGQRRWPRQQRDVLVKALGTDAGACVPAGTWHERVDGIRGGALQDQTIRRQGIRERHRCGEAVKGNHGRCRADDPIGPATAIIIRLGVPFVGPLETQGLRADIIAETLRNDTRPHASQRGTGPPPEQGDECNASHTGKEPTQRAESFMHRGPRQDDHGDTRDHGLS
jgi:hypothetical protein